jgi:predicted DNA-binding transcriptional regulator AlpA
MNRTTRKIIRRPAVRGITGLSDSSIDRHEKAGDFPVRVHISANAVGWYEDEILDHVNNLPRGICAAPVAANAARRGG